MRLAPVPIRWWSDREAAAEHAAASSRTTHPADRPVDACRVYGAMIAALISGADFDDVIAPAFWTGEPLDPEVAEVIAGSWAAKEPPAIRGSGFVVHALEAAIWAVAGATDFRDAVLRAANLGDDADTTAAIAGQLAGARWGLAGIPDAWVGQLTASDRIIAIAGALHDAGAASGPIADAEHAEYADHRIEGTPIRWEHDDVVHGWWSIPGVLAGEYPGDRSPERARYKIDLLVDHGIRTFVDLTGPNDRLVPYESTLADVGADRGLELRRVNYRIPDGGVIDEDGYDAIVATIEDARRRGGVFVHCWGGIGRTGTVIGCVLVGHGLDAERALERIAELRQDTKKAARPAPENSTQAAVIRRRAAR